MPDSAEQSGMAGLDEVKKREVIDEHLFVEAIALTKVAGMRCTIMPSASSPYTNDLPISP